MELEVGKYYRSRGGWKAVVIWETTKISNLVTTYYYVVHRPATKDESIPVCHDSNGRSQSSFSVNEPPSYDLHPADLVELWTEE